MPQTPSNEYCNLVRIDQSRGPPTGFTFVSTSAPALQQQLWRTLTFARGLTLYEVWDDWDQIATGYMVPSFIAGIVAEYRHGISTELWANLPLHQRNRLTHARSLVLERFPRMPEIAVTRIAERAQREQWNGDKKKLEERVVNQVRHEWSSYETRLEHFERHPLPTANTANELRQRETSLNRKKDEVLEIVKPRIRDLLVSWLPKDINGSELAQFFRRYHLFDSAYGDGAYKEKSVLVKTSSLPRFDGLETPANLLVRTELIL